VRRCTSPQRLDLASVVSTLRISPRQDSRRLSVRSFKTSSQPSGVRRCTSPQRLDLASVVSTLRISPRKGSRRLSVRSFKTPRRFYPSYKPLPRFEASLGSQFQDLFPTFRVRRCTSPQRLDLASVVDSNITCMTWILLGAAFVVLLLTWGLRSEIEVTAWERD
jgi:hypothetical protein